MTAHQVGQMLLALAFIIVLARLFGLEDPPPE